MEGLKVKILASGAHVHLSRQDLETLFGEGSELGIVKMLGEGKAGQFLSDKKVTLCGPKANRSLSVIGPLRKETQLELSYTEARKIGFRPPIGDSGKLEDTLGCTLETEHGKVVLERGLMVPRRHIHLNIDEAEHFGIKDGQMVKVYVEGPRSLLFENCLVRIRRDGGSSVMHVDYDEMNATGLLDSGFCYIITE